MNYYITRKAKIQCGESSFYEKPGQWVWIRVRKESRPAGARAKPRAAPEGRTMRSIALRGGCLPLWQWLRKKQKPASPFCGEAGGKTESEGQPSADLRLTVPRMTNRVASISTMPMGSTMTALGIKPAMI